MSKFISNLKLAAALCLGMTTAGCSVSIPLSSIGVGGSDSKPDATATRPQTPVRKNVTAPAALQR